MTEIQQLAYLSDYFVVHFVHFSISTKLRLPEGDYCIIYNISRLHFLMHVVLVIALNSRFPLNPNPCVPVTESRLNNMWFGKKSGDV